MAQFNTTSTLDGLFKKVYGDAVVNATPEIAIIQKKVPFKATQRIGKNYSFPVILSCEAGVTYLAAGSGVQTLNNAIAAQLNEATVDANQIIIRGQMDYEAAAKAASGGAAAFQSASELLVQNLMETGAQRLEIAFIYGQSGTGLGTAASSVNINTTSTTVTMSLAGWAPGIWAGKENATVNFSKVSDNTIVSSGVDAIFSIVSVDFVNKKLVFSGTTVGIAALDTALAAPCYITFSGAKTGTTTFVEPIGIDAIVSNVGTLFGISAATYGLWSGSTYSFGSAAATTAKLLNMVGLAVSKGGLMEEVDILLSPKTFMNLSGTMTDLRRQNGGQSETEGIAGFETIVLMGPNGKMNLIPHAMIKEGECFAVPLKKRFKRIGTQEFSFETPGRKGELFLHVPDKNAYELRLYCAQAIICETPAKCVKGNLIVNT